MSLFLGLRSNRAPDAVRGRARAPFGFLFGMLALALVSPGQAVARSAPDSFADLAAQLLPSVVNVSTTQVVEGNAGIDLPQLPPGSPFEEFF